MKRSPSTVRLSFPFWSSVRLFAIDRPRPLPSLFLDVSPRVNHSRSSSGEMSSGSREMFLKDTTA